LYLKPINCTTVDEGWKHPQSVPKSVADGAHRQANMEIAFHSLDEVVVHCHRCALDLFPCLPNNRLGRKNLHYYLCNRFEPFTASMLVCCSSICMSQN